MDQKAKKYKQRWKQRIQRWVSKTISDPLTADFVICVVNGVINNIVGHSDHSKMTLLVFTVRIFLSALINIGLAYVGDLIASTYPNTIDEKGTKKLIEDNSLDKPCNPEFTDNNVHVSSQDKCESDKYPSS